MQLPFQKLALGVPSKTKISKKKETMFVEYYSFYIKY